MDIESQENSAIFWKEKGDEYFKSGNYDDAISCYRNAIEIDGKYIEAWNNYGYALYKQGKIDQAKKIREKIKELESQRNPEKPQKIEKKSRALEAGMIVIIFVIIALIFAGINYDFFPSMEGDSTPSPTFSPQPTTMTYSSSSAVPTSYPIHSSHVDGNYIIISYDGDWWLNSLATDTNGKKRQEFDVEGNGNREIKINDNGVTVDGCLMRLDEKQGEICIGIANYGRIIEYKCSNTKNLVCFSGDV
jgi:tetratricopeptide (TPR) repeat protein